MKTKTHFLIAKIAAIRAGLNSAEQLVFSLGAAAPDLLPTQFLHPHFYQSSVKYVFRRLMRLENKAHFWRFFSLARWRTTSAISVVQYTRMAKLEILESILAMNCACKSILLITILN